MSNPSAPTLNRLVRINIGGDLAVTTDGGEPAPSPPSPPPLEGFELREDGSFELREDGSFELRDVNSEPILNEIVVRFRSSTDQLQYLAQYQAYQTDHIRGGVPVIAIGGTFDPSNCSSLITLTDGNTVANVGSSGFSAVLTSNTWYGPADDKASVVEFEIVTGSTANFYVGAHLVPTAGYAPFTPDADMKGTNSTCGYCKDGTAFDPSGTVGSSTSLVSGDVVGILAYGGLFFFINGIIVPVTVGHFPPGIRSFPMFARITP